MPIVPISVVEFSPKSLYECLSNALVTPADVESHRHATYLAGYLGTLKARTIVTEAEYTDGDYLDDFASFYVKCFQAYPRRCRRLHFFSSALTEADLRKLIVGEGTPQQLEELRAAYLGFVVSRPLPDAIIGRTVLRTYDDDGGRRSYTVTKDYNANLYGIRLSVRSLAFQEQDSVLAACATVALWSAFHKTADLFGTPIPTPVEITRVANQINLPSRPVPSHGLNLQQICNSIRHVGLEPEVFQVGPGTPLVTLIYAHLRMGLPVILIVEVEGRELHAITVAGYSLLDSPVRTSEVTGPNTTIPLVGLRIDKFYGHDDQFGPFGRIDIGPAATWENTEYPVVFTGTWTLPNSQNPARLFPIAAVVPVYHKIRLTFLDVLQRLTGLNQVIDLVRSSLNQQGNIEWDVSLSTSNSYKERAKGASLPPSVLEEVLMSQHPRFIWDVVVALDKTPLLRLLVDATDMARSFPIYRVVWHNTALATVFTGLLSNPGAKTALASSSVLGARFVDLLGQSLNP